MSKKNVYLMQIQNLISGKYFLPLPLGFIWGYAEKFPEVNENYHLDGLFIFREQVESYLDQMNDPKIVGISTYVWNWEVSKAFAIEVKKRWPDTVLVMGGPHVPYEPSFVKENSWLDYIVSFEGEEQFAELLIHLNSDESDKDPEIEGLIHKNSEIFSKRKSQKLIDDIPSPYLSGFFDSIIKENPDKGFNIILETNRGCPYTCSFCDMQDSFYQKLRQFEMDRVKAELDWASKHQIEYIECADSNFGIFERDIEIIEYVCHLRRETSYPRSFNFTSAKNQPKHVEKIQKLLVANDLKRGISISLQSFNPDVLKAISRWNDYDGLQNKIDRYSDEGYESYIELILGLPQETKKSWIDGINSILELGYKGSLLIHPLSVVPNTPFSNRDYIKAHGLKYTTTRSPAQGFCFGTESPEEREQICYESSTMPAEDWIDSYYYGKSLVGAYYFHGLSYYLVEYLRKEGIVSRSDFFVSLLDYVKSSQGFLAREYEESTRLLKESLFNLRPWGRKVFGETDMYWSDQAASAMAAIKNYKEFSEDLVEFVSSEFAYNKSSLLQDSLEKPTDTEVIKDQYDYNWHDYFSKESQLVQSPSQYLFIGKKFKDYRDHALNIYWYGRKSRRCFVKEIRSENL